MENILVFPAGGTEAVQYAAAYLAKAGIPLTDHPTPEVSHLLLDVPSFGPDGALRTGGQVEDLLERLPEGITVAGGNLEHPALAGYQKLDLLQDAGYAAQNAAITADCALGTAIPLLKTTFADTPTLVIGWGRIGKCLAALLKGIGAPVTVAARKESDRAILEALGYEAVDIAGLDPLLPRFRLVFNTAPAPVLTAAQSALCQGVKIDLASKLGMAGPDVIWARGLPGLCAPESSGKLIAETFLRLLKEGAA